MLFETEYEAGATFSECRVWRYKLWRIWNPEQTSLVCCGLNPSTADEREDDPTIRRVIGFAKKWGFGGMVMLNLFGYRATDPEVMLKHAAPVGPGNDEAIREELCRAGMFLAAWGDSGGALGRERGKAVMQIAHEAKRTAYCLGTTQGHGSPRHPLYIAADFQPIIYKG